MASLHVAVIGGGFAGAATALHLVRRGARVTLLERDPIAGAHASSQNAGMLRTAIADPALARVAVAGARGLEQAQTWADAPLVRPSGSLLLASGAELDALRAVVPALKELRRNAEWIEPAAATARVPALAGTSFDAALWTPEDGVADTAAYLAALLRGARQDGATLRLGTEVTSGDPGDESRPARLATEKGVIEADAVVIAAGAWSDVVAGRLGLPLRGLVPYRRHLHATGPFPSVDPGWPFVWALGDEVYFRPESGGLLLSPCDEEPFEPGEPPADPENRALLARKVAATFPALVDLPVMRSWAGLRTFAPDRRFVLGRDPTAPRVFWAAGLAGHGMTCAWEIGRIVADSALGLAPAPAEFDPARRR
ncbi:MAG: FAD-binding oxidoreductase [Deltaproteobacteria bacterium]|nr:FAD-binding oxidoreductase [Deltaproteobacteria bacterium]